MLEQIKVTYEELPFTVDPAKLVPRRAQRARTATWRIRASIFECSNGRRRISRPRRRPGSPAGRRHRVVVRRLDAGFAAAKLVLDETFVTAGLGHHSMEPRSALAYWQNGKCLHGSTQSQSFPIPGIARLCGVEPADLVYVSEFCGGGFGSKGGAYPLMAIPALMSKKIGRPVMMRVSRHEEYFMGSARAGFQGRAKMASRPTAVCGRRPL